MRIIRDSTPAADGFRMPAEYEPHEGCIMIFPERPDSWQYGGYAARRAFAQVAEAIAESEHVTVCAGEAQYDNARAILPEHIRVVEMSSNDAWARDYGPTFVKNRAGEVRGIDWGFNAWGGLRDGLYFPWDKDNRMARKLCDLLEKPVYDKRSFILEGGSIHVDGEGTCLVTERCLLSPGRNPRLSREQIEEILREYLNVSTVIWLPCGIYGDETNEHVDNICAFVAPGEVVLAWTEDQNDVQYSMSKACLDYLEGCVDARGRRLKVHKLPLPEPVTVTAEECGGLDACWDEPTRTPGERLAASYVNFYISNGNIVMPAFGDPADQRAAEILQGLFPRRKVVQIYARDILIGGGNIHCITQQIPASQPDQIPASLPDQTTAYRKRRMSGPNDSMQKAPGRAEDKLRRERKRNYDSSRKNRNRGGGTDVLQPFAGGKHGGRGAGGAPGGGAGGADYPSAGAF